MSYHNKEIKRIRKLLQDVEVSSDSEKSSEDEEHSLKIDIHILDSECETSSDKESFENCCQDGWIGKNKNIFWASTCKIHPKTRTGLHNMIFKKCELKGASFE